MNRALRKLATGLVAAGLAIGSQAAIAFDFDTGRAPSEVVIPTLLPIVLSDVSPTGSDASVVLRVTTTMSNAWFDAIAPYHPTAVGVYSNLGRRPAGEAATNRNLNIAIMYASYKAMNSLFPHQNARWRAMMQSVGLNPDDNQENRTTPIGIGNLAGKALVAVRERDGMNQLGDEAGCKYNCRPYADYTGYKPMNTPYELRFPGRWQPMIGTTGNGLFRSQVGVTPQWAVTLPYTYQSPIQFALSPAPVKSDPRNFAAYKAQADEVLAASAGLTDYQKMSAELFNHKLFSIGFMELFGSRNLPLDQAVHFIFMSNMALWDGGIATWHNKFVHDAVRPFSAIRWIYGNREVTAWGGPGKGTVTDLPGSQWNSYLNTADHPEYPSGSSCFCSAHAQAARRYHGTDNFGFSSQAPRGSSFVEPGITPATDLTLTYATYTQMENECSMSRVWGGVHFRAATLEGQRYCRKFGDRAFEFIKRRVAGN